MTIKPQRTPKKRAAPGRAGQAQGGKAPGRRQNPAIGSTPLDASPEKNADPSPRQSQSQSQSRRQRTEVRRPQIVLSATRILATEGPRKLTANRLGQDVGISAGAIFRHFPTMDAIIDAVLERMEELLFEQLDADLGSDPLQRLEAFFVHRMTCLAKHPEIARLLLSDQFTQGGASDQAERLQTFKKRTQAFIASALSEAQAQGRLKPNTRTEDAALLIVGAVLAFAYQTPGLRAQERTQFQPEALARRLFRAMRNGLFVDE